MSNFYKPSGIIPPSAKIALPLIIAIFASILAPLYALISYHVHSYALVKFVFTATYSCAVGFFAGYIIQKLHVRAPGKAVLLALLGALIGFYVHWAFWLSFYTADHRPEIATSVLLTSPGLFFETLKDANEVGTWAIKKLAARGGFLWVVWFCELGIFLLMVWVLSSDKGESPYYEEGKVWFKPRKTKYIYQYPSSEQQIQEVTNQLKSGDFAYFLATPIQETPPALPYFSLTLYTAQGAPYYYGQVDMLSQKAKKPEETETILIAKYVQLSGHFYDNLVSLHPE